MRQPVCTLLLRQQGMAKRKMIKILFKILKLFIKIHFIAISIHSPFQIVAFLNIRLFKYSPFQIVAFSNSRLYDIRLSRSFNSNRYFDTFAYSIFAYFNVRYFNIKYSLIGQFAHSIFAYITFALSIRHGYYWLYRKAKGLGASQN